MTHVHPARTLVFGTIALLLPLAGCGGTGEAPVTATPDLTPALYRIADLVTDSSGAWSEDDPFGELSGAGDEGSLVLGPGAWVAFDLPQTGGLLELEIDYYPESGAHFQLRSDTAGVLLLEGRLDPEPDYDFTWLIAPSQSYTAQVDLRTHPTVQDVILTNTSATMDLVVGAFLYTLPIEAHNDAGVYVADIGLDSPRILPATTTATELPWEDFFGGVGWIRAVTTPDDFITHDSNITLVDLVFDVSDVLRDMTHPVFEINLGRVQADTVELTLFGEGDLIAYYESNYDDYDEMGQTLIVDVTDWKDSAYFVIHHGNGCMINPYLKIQDAAATGRTSRRLDISPDGAHYVSHAGRMAFHEGTSTYADDRPFSIEHEAPHWYAEPAAAPYGADGTLTFRLPSDVASWGDPVLRVLVFPPNSGATDASGRPEDPGVYPIEIELLDDLGVRFAHLRFDDWNTYIGGVLRSQVPLAGAANSPTITMRVTGAPTAWCQAAFPPFIEVAESR